LSSRRYEVTEKNLNETDTKIYDTKLTIKTPDGVQVVVNRGSPNNPGTIHLKREVETAEGLKVATWREGNTTWEWVEERFNRHQKEVDDLGTPTMYTPRMNIQARYIEKMYTVTTSSYTHAGTVIADW